VESGEEKHTNRDRERRIVRVEVAKALGFSGVNGRAKSLFVDLFWRAARSPQEPGPSVTSTNSKVQVEKSKTDKQQANIDLNFQPKTPKHHLRTEI